MESLACYIKCLHSAPLNNTDSACKPFTQGKSESQCHLCSVVLGITQLYLLEIILIHLQTILIYYQFNSQTS